MRKENIITGNYYILFEVKYFSGFGEETDNRKSQLIREIEGGMFEAKTLEKQFILVAITADYFFKENKFDEIKKFTNINFKWINWQTVSNILANYLEKTMKKIRIIYKLIYFFMSFKNLKLVIENKKLKTIENRI